MQNYDLLTILPNILKTNPLSSYVPYKSQYIR